MVFMALWLLMLSLDVMVVASPDLAPLPVSPSQANVQIVETLDGIQRNLQSSSYSHATSVDEATGRYDFDCSGMVQFVLGEDLTQRPTRCRSGAFAGGGLRPRHLPCARSGGSYGLATDPAHRRRPPRRRHRVGEASDRQVCEHRPRGVHHGGP